MTLTKPIDDLKSENARLKKQIEMMEVTVRLERLEQINNYLKLDNVIIKGHQRSRVLRWLQSKKRNPHRTWWPSRAGYWSLPESSKSKCYR